MYLCLGMYPCFVIIPVNLYFFAFFSRRLLVSPYEVAMFVDKQTHFIVQQLVGNIIKSAHMDAQTDELCDKEIHRETSCISGMFAQLKPSRSSVKVSCL